MKKRLISILLSVAMLAGTLPVTALGADETGQKTAIQEENAAETGIDYKKNGGTFVDGYEAPDNYPASDLPTKDQIKKEGYEFDGWYENEDFSGEKVTSLDTSGHLGNVVLYAKWKERYYYVDIPESVSANSEDLKVVADAGGLYDKDYVSVSVQSENNWKLKNGNRELGYELRNKENAIKLENDTVVADLTKDKEHAEQGYRFNILDKAKYTGKYTDQLTFGIAFQDTDYHISYEADGGKVYKENPEKPGEMIAVTSDDLKAGTTLNQLPEAVKKSSTFLGWCYDEARTQYVSSKDRLLKDITLYAAYADNQEQESVSMATYARAVDVATDFTIDVTDMGENLTADQIKSACTIKNVSDSSEQITLELTEKPDHTFTISNPDGWKPGSSYRLELKNKSVYFTGFDKTIREYDFTVYKESVENVELSDKLKYIHISDLSDLTVNGKKTDKVSVAVMTVGTDGSVTKEGSDTTGTFTYKKQKLNIGDQIAVYTGDVIPTMDMSSGKDSEVSFFEITGAKGNQYTYRGAKAEDVLFMPDVLPLSRSKDMDGQPDNNSVTVAKSDLTFGNDEMSRALQLDGNTKVDEGDYLALYTDTDSGTPDYGEITSVSTSGDQYIVGYRPVTWDEVQETMDVYRKENVEGDELLEDTDREKLEEDIETQAADSGFATEVVENIADAAMKTESFEELEKSLQEDLGADISLHGIPGGDGRLDYGIAIQAAGRAGGSGNPRVEAELDHVNADLGTRLKHFDGNVSGLRLALEIGVKITIHVNKGADIEILVTATFEQEVRVDINVDGEAVWKVWKIFPYIADYRVTASMDLYEYTGIGLNVQFKSVETGFIDNGSKLRKGVNKITEELKSMMENGEEYISDKTKFDVDAEGDISVSKSLAQRYAELLKDESDWVEIYQRDLVNQHFRVILIIDIEVKLEFVVSANVNVSIGMTYWYKNAKRYVFCVYVKDRKATNDTIDLCEEQYEFTAYAMGTVGLRAGVRLTVSIGLVSTKLASVGVSAEAGGYAQVWGYLYYELKYTASAGRSSRSMGAVYLEIGIYLEVKFKAQALSNAFTYNPTLYENEWPLYRVGSIESVLDFAYTQDDVEQINLKRDIQSVILPDDYFKMQYLHMKEGMNDGEYFERIYDDDPKYFSIVMTNPAFTYDPETNRVRVIPGNEPEQDGEMIITWKNQKGSFNTKAVTRRISLHWDRLRDGYYIGFVSNGGSYVNTITGKYNSDVKTPKNPVKEGYTFAGWYEDEELTKPYQIPSKMPEYDKVVYAKWDAADVDYKVINHVEKTNGTYEEEKLVTHKGKTGTKVSPVPEEKAGYTTPEQLSAVVKADGSTEIHYYYARAEHKITFISEGEVISEGTYKYGAVMPTPAVYRPGYEFAGWSEGTEEDPAEVPEEVPDTDMIYTAKWKAKDGISYTVKYYVQDAETGSYNISDIKTLTGKTEEEVTAPDAGYSKKIYSRKGELPKGRIAADGSLELKVYYDLNSYTITCDAKGGNLDQHEVTGRPGEKVALPVPVRKGYIFQGWFADEAYEQAFGKTMPDEDTTIYAKWEKQKVNYTVRYLRENIDESNPWDMGEKERTYTLYEEEVFSAEADTEVTPEVRSYKGFETPEEQKVKVKGDGSLVVEYRYNRKVHELYMNISGKEGTVRQMQYGAALTEIPVSLGYVFEGWYTDDTYEHPFDGIMPDKDITIYAKWRALECNYHVLHYLQNVQDSWFTLAEDEVFKGLTGTEVNPDTKTYEGFDTPEKEKGYIYGDGGPYIHYYYYRNKYALTYVQNNGEDSKKEEVLYGSNISYVPKRAGYAFTGWYLDEQLTKPLSEQTMPAKALTLYAKWEPGKKGYHVRNYLQKDPADDGYELKETLNYTGTAGEEVAPEVKTYVGFTSPETKKYVLQISDEEDMIDYYYTRNRYQVTCHYNNGEEDKTEELPYGRKIEKRPLREGYQFEGWYLDAGFKKAFDGSVPAENIDIYAKWKALEVGYTVKHYLQNANDDGFTLKNSEDGSKETDSEITPEVKNYKGFTAPEKQTVKVKGDGSLVVEYRYLRNTHNLVLKGYKGDEDNTLRARYEMTIPTTFREGYIFEGWFLDKEYKKKFESLMPDKDLTLYAKWEAKEVNYTVRYYLQNLEGEGYSYHSSASARAMTGSEAEAPREEFTGFELPEIQKVKITGDSSMVVKYYYKRSTHKATFDWNDGNGTTEVISGRYGSVVNPKMPKRTGYRFVKWDKNPAATIMDHDVTYTAQWQQMIYTLTFDLKGGVVGADHTSACSQTLAYNEKVTVPENPTRTGYRFVGWRNEIPDKMPAENRTIEAVWELKTYKIEYDLNGGTEKGNNPDTYTYEDRVITLAEPERTGYTFKGWQADGKEQIISAITHNSYGDLKLKAKWEENKYKIQLKIAGDGTKVNKSYGTEPAYHVNYTQEVKLPEDAFIRDGYSLVGWRQKKGKEEIIYKSNAVVSKLAGENGTEVILTPIWYANKYEIHFDFGDGQTYDWTECRMGETFSVPADNGYRQGYIFTGWRREKSNDKNYEPGQQKIVMDEPNDIKMYGCWEPVKSYHFDTKNKNATYRIIDNKPVYKFTFYLNGDCPWPNTSIYSPDIRNYHWNIYSLSPDALKARYKNMKIKVSFKIDMVEDGYADFCLYYTKKDSSETKWKTEEADLRKDNGATKEYEYTLNMEDGIDVNRIKLEFDAHGKNRDIYDMSELSVDIKFY